MKASTWINKAYTTGGSTASAQESAVVGKSHFVSGIAVSCVNLASGYPETAILKIHTGTSPTYIFELDIVGSTGAYSYAAGTEGHLIINFTNPIQVPEGEQVSVELDPYSTSSKAQVNVWGFTSATRQED